MPKKTEVAVPKWKISFIIPGVVVELLDKAVECTGITTDKIVAEALDAYCRRKIKAAEKKQAGETEQSESNSERVLKVVNLYNSICCPPMAWAPAEEWTARSKTGKNILSKPAEYDWEKHFRAAAGDKWMCKQPWCCLEWLVGKGFSKTSSRAGRSALTQNRRNGNYDAGWTGF